MVAGWWPDGGERLGRAALPFAGRCSASPKRVVSGSAPRVSLAKDQLVVLLSLQGVFRQEVSEFHRILPEKPLPLLLDDDLPLRVLVLELVMLLSLVLAFSLVHLTPQSDEAFCLPLVLLRPHAPLVLVQLLEPVVLGELPHQVLAHLLLLRA